MQYRKFGKAQTDVSVIGLGTWAMGGGEAWSGETDDKSSIETIDFAVANGINMIDTAYVYGKGHSEEIVGKAIKKYREKVFLTTKLQRWIFPDRDGVMKEFDETLKRLDTDYVDLYMIHWPMEDKLPAEKTLDAMMELKAQGKVKMIGLSNFYLPLLQRIVPNYDIDAVQLPYNLFWRFLEDGTQQFCIDNNISIMTYSSLQQGLLTGKYKKTDTFAANDMRAKNKLFKGEQFEKCLDAIEGMKKIAAKYNVSMPTLALNWVLSQPGITNSLVGAMNPTEVGWNLGAGDFSISAEDMAELDKLSKAAVSDLKPTDVMWDL